MSSSRQSGICAACKSRIRTDRLSSIRRTIVQGQTADPRQGLRAAARPVPEFVLPHLAVENPMQFFLDRSMVLDGRRSGLPGRLELLEACPGSLHGDLRELEDGRCLNMDLLQENLRVGLRKLRYEGRAD